jgi:hypothetical protein
MYMFLCSFILPLFTAAVDLPKPCYFNFSVDICMMSGDLYNFSYRLLKQYGEGSEVGRSLMQWYVKQNNKCSDGKTVVTCAQTEADHLPYVVELALRAEEVTP